MNVKPWYSTLPDYLNWIFDGAFLGADDAWPRSREGVASAMRSHLGDAFDEDVFNAAWDKLVADGRLRPVRNPYAVVPAGSTEEMPRDYAPVYEKKLSRGKLSAILSESGVEERTMRHLVPTLPRSRSIKYKCGKCGKRFGVSSKNRHIVPVCPKCGSKDIWMAEEHEDRIPLDVFLRDVDERAMTPAQRAKLPKKAFAGPSRSYPVQDKKHVMAAIAYAKKYWNAGGESQKKARAAWANIVGAAKRFGITIHGKPGEKMQEKKEPTDAELNKVEDDVIKMFNRRGYPTYGDDRSGGVHISFRSDLTLSSGTADGKSWGWDLINDKGEILKSGDYKISINSLDTKLIFKRIMQVLRKVKNIVEGYNERGKRDGTGPFKGSYMRKKFGKGRRKLAGEKCPASVDEALSMCATCAHSYNRGHRFGCELEDKVVKKYGKKSLDRWLLKAQKANKCDFHKTYLASKE